MERMFESNMQSRQPSAVSQQVPAELLVEKLPNELSS
jgi:hypothetical protein